MSEEIKVRVVKYPDRENLVLRYRDPYTGRHVTKSAETSDRDEAIKAAGKWEDDLHNGRYKAPSRVTWQEFRDKYESEVLSGLATATKAKVCGVLDAVEKYINPDRVRDITGDRLSYYVSKLRKAKRAESTIAGHLAHLRAALSYAVEWGYLAQLPELGRQQRAKRASTMKGRPITGEEFDRMITNTEAIVGDKAAESWKQLLRGLWLSGLRLSESLALSWDDSPGAIVVDLDGRRPMLRIPAEAQKARRDELHPIAPEFAEFLYAIPEAERTGRVFRLKRQRQRYPGPMKKQHVSDTISRIGKKAGVVVNPDTGKTASAHDLRRAFGLRWASRVMPQILMQLMRHRDISTTMKYYVGREAEATADVLWKAVQVTNPVTETTTA